jgi:Icc protein
MTVQYVAVISDQHITERGTRLYGLDTNSSAQELFVDLAKASLPKLVVSLGDLADTTLNPERSEATGSTEAYRNVLELARPLTQPFLAIPGNHDDPALLSSFLSNRWDYTRNGVSVRTFNHVDLIGIDGRTGPEATGLIAEETLAELDRALEQSRAAILLTHYPVADLDNPWVNDNLSVRNRDLLVPLFRKYREKVLACLSGHLHMRYMTDIEGVVCHGAPSTAFMFRMQPGSSEPISVSDNPCGYLLLGIDPERPLFIHHEYTQGAQREG